MDIAPTEVVDKYNAKKERLYQYVLNNIAGCLMKPPAHKFQFQMNLLWFAALIYVYERRLGYRGNTWEKNK